MHEQVPQGDPDGKSSTRTDYMPSTSRPLKNLDALTTTDIQVCWSEGVLDTESWSILPSWKNVLSDADKQKVIGNIIPIWQLSAVNIIKLNKKLSSVHDNYMMNYE
jgi:hypothetical protein